MRDIKRVLVVEDNEEVMQTVAQMLRMDRYQVHEATSVAEAAAVLNEHPVDLVLSDFVLGEQTAHDVLTIILAQKPVPLMLVMSGFAKPVDAFDMGRAGVAGYLAKPFDQQQLRRAVEEARNYRFPVALIASSCVGNQSVRDLAGDIRDAMTTQAKALANGNKTRMARYLRIQRQSLGK